VQAVVDEASRSRTSSRWSARPVGPGPPATALPVVSTALLIGVHPVRSLPELVPAVPPSLRGTARRRAIDSPTRLGLYGVYAARVEDATRTGGCRADAHHRRGEDTHAMTENLGALHQELAGVVHLDRALDEVLTEIVHIARRAIPGSDATSITLIRDERAFTAAFDGQLSMDADQLQYDRGYGPCLDAGRSGEVFLVTDMRTEERWPDYAQQGAELGVSSSLSIPLPFQGASIGALNNYARRPGAFGEPDVAVAEDVASFIAVAVVNAEVSARATDDAANMRQAMVSRAVIEQAKGILMERYKVTSEQAFTLLTHASQLGNIKLRDVAEELTSTGVLHGS
jgi:GAF domain-containing protein